MPRTAVDRHDTDPLGARVDGEAETFFLPPEAPIEEPGKRATESPAEAVTWRLEALLQAHGFNRATAHARKAVEESLRREGWAVDPPLRTVPPRTDVWVYPLPAQEPRVPPGEAAHAPAPSSEQSVEGLTRGQKGVVLAVCGFLALAGAALVLSATGNLSRLLPTSGLRAASGEQSPIEESFARAYGKVLKARGTDEMRLQGVRCVASARDQYRCQAMTKVVGSGTYPAQFEVTVAGGCWRADPVAPNLINNVVEGCA